MLSSSFGFFGASPSPTLITTFVNRGMRNGFVVFNCSINRGRTRVSYSS